MNFLKSGKHGIQKIFLGDFIAKCRKGETHQYDIVEGPMVIDTVTAWLLKGAKSFMTEQEKNDLFYVCSLIEYIARQTKNKRGAIVEALGESGVRKQLYDAQINHCLSFEQVSDEVIEQSDQTGRF